MASPSRCIGRRRAVGSFAVALTLFIAAMWTAQYLRSSWLGAMVLAGAVLGGSALTRPGWNVRPHGSLVRMLFWCSLLSASGIAAAVILATTHIALPYTPAKIQVLSVLPRMVALVATEELLFRQVMYRWLETHMDSASLTMTFTALAFGLAHLGPAFDPGSPLRLFTVLQAAYLILIGGLLGELRRISGSWLISSIGHLIYNLSPLVALMLITPSRP